MSGINTRKNTGWLGTVAASLLILAGAAVWLKGSPRFGTHSLPMDLRLVRTQSAGEANFPDIDSFFPVQTLRHYAISRAGRDSVALQVAEYKDSGGQKRSAIVEWRDDTDTALSHDTQPERLRYQAWQSALPVLRRLSSRNPLFLSEWDNAQRIHLYSGNRVWLRSPVEVAYPDDQRKELWGVLGGGFAEEPERSRQLAHWFTMEAEAALAEMADRFSDTEWYLLVTLDDLARLSELSALTDQCLPFETRLFAPNGNFHALINGVKKWASECANGHYLLQKLPMGHLRAWRICTEAGETSLLARLLPFTSSTAPLPQLALLHRSEMGYMSLYRYSRRRGSE